MATLKTRAGKEYDNVFPTHSATGVTFILEVAPGTQTQTRFFIPYENIESIITPLESE